MPIFPCTQCGLCCKNVHVAPETQFLDRGDGACKYYDDASKKCTIYEQRPNICRVDRMFKLQYKEVYTWNQYVDLNIQACEVLQKKL